MSSSRLAGMHILSAEQFTRSDLRRIFVCASKMRRRVYKSGVSRLLKDKVMACVFYEPSTRTSSSFIAAMQRLGGQVISITDVQCSSVAKGETLSDTVRIMEAYADVIVLRHPRRGAAAEASRFLRKPLINAGDGDGEHPTQALLDMFTVHEAFGGFGGLTVTLVGDLRYGRTVHALVRLLGLYRVNIRLISTEELRLPKNLIEELKMRRVDVTEHRALGDCLKETDVLYVTRVQKERFSSVKEYERVKDAYHITADVLRSAKNRMIVTHPLPRLHEIATDVDVDPRAAYFHQVENGLYVRMALLAMVLGRA